MAEENMIKTLCSNCGTVYDLDSSLIGEYGECAECGVAFQIQDQTEYIIQALAAMEAAPAEEAEAPAEEAPAQPEEAPVVEEVPAQPEEAPAVSEPAPAPAAPPITSIAPAPAAEAAPAADAPAEEPVYTNTVKLTRVKSSGMIPQSLQDDSFKVGTINASTQSVIGTSRGNRKFTNARKFSSSSSRRPAPPKKKSFWDILCFWKKK